MSRKFQRLLWPFYPRVAMRLLCCAVASGTLVLFSVAPGQGQSTDGNSRRLRTPVDERYWLENMVRDHRFTLDEVAAATGMSVEDAKATLRKYELENAAPLPRAPGGPLRVLPYPGGRHPRIGFLEGAIDPQRETKISVFTPWDETSYVVVDVPEAIFSNLGLTYLAHTHIPTIWSAKQIELPPLEWNRRDDGTLEIERTLPNGIAFGTRVVPEQQAVRMELWLRNGTRQPLTELRVQNCVMLKGAAGFDQQTSTNKVLVKPFAAASDRTGRRWVITAWDPCDRTWDNPDVPCVHSDPVFPNCAPGETVRVRGRISFYEGTGIKEEFQRIERIGWRGSTALPTQ